VIDRHGRAVATGCSTLLFAAVLGWVIAHRAALTMDELHTLLLGRLVSAGSPLPFYEGSVSRYEGGSWLIGFPVGWLLAVGVGPVAATSWTAGALAILSVGLGTWWLGGLIRPRDAAFLGPVAAFAAPECMHYAYRAWGSIAEGLVMLPVLALLRGHWRSRGAPLQWAPLLGLGLTVAIVLSYVHFVTALAFVAWELLDGGPERPSFVRRAVGCGIVATTTALGLLGWALLSGPNPEELLAVRDGRPLVATLRPLLLPDLRAVAGHLHRGWVGEHLLATPARLSAGAVLTGLSVLGFAHAWRKGPELRGLTVFAIAFVPALSVGHSLLAPPDVYRYHLPWLAASCVAITTLGPRGTLPALASALVLWWPDGLPNPYQNPNFTHLELGGNAMHRATRDPHRKFIAFHSVVEPWARPWFEFGYGVDSGRRFGPTLSGMRQTLSTLPDPERTLQEDPHFSLARVPRWLELGPAASGAFDFGVGHGLASDGRIDAVELELLDAASNPRRLAILQGVGADLLRALERPGFHLGADWDAPLRLVARVGDYDAIGQGMAAVSSGQLPPGADLGLPAGPLLDELRRGARGPIDRALRAMSRVPLVPTP
jgi:hypothetical protein